MIVAGTGDQRQSHWEIVEKGLSYRYGRDLWGHGVENCIADQIREEVSECSAKM